MLAAGAKAKQHVKFTELRVEIRDDGPKRLPLTLTDYTQSAFR